MNVDYKLYLCTESKLMSTETIEKCVEDAILGGVSIVQVREKYSDAFNMRETAKKVQKITSKYNIPLIINDNIDVALEIDADGVHLGQDDIPCSYAREILGKDKIIGISVTNVKQALEAKINGADYIGVGAMFKSKTKPEASVVSLEELKKIRSVVDLPIVLIGGINKKTIPVFKNIDIEGYAMITPIISQPNIYDAAQELLEIIDNNKVLVKKHYG